MKNIKSIIIKCKTSSFKQGVMKCCLEFFNNPDLLDIMDADKTKLGVLNGIYDTRTETFRNGEPSDFISKSTNARYRDDFTLESKEVVDMLNFFEEIIPQTDVREYFLHNMSTILQGGNTYKRVPIWIGNGHNGKTVTVELFQKLLGKYSLTLPATVITGKRKDGPNPGLARVDGGVRACFISETSDNENINIGILKQLSGNDTFYARKLHENGRDIKPQFTLFVQCNKPPKVRDADRAVWIRLRLIPFESKFVEHSKSPKTREEQLEKKIFPIDKERVERISKNIDALLWLLVYYRRKYKGKAPPPTPKAVSMKTNEYRNENDIFGLFVNDILIKCQESKTRPLYVKDVYSAFKIHYKETYANSANNIPDKLKTVRKICEILKIKSNNHRRIKTLPGWRFKTETEKLEETEKVSQYDDVSELPK